MVAKITTSHMVFFQFLGLAVDLKSLRLNIEMYSFCHKCNNLGHDPDIDKNYVLLTNLLFCFYFQVRL